MKEENDTPQIENLEVHVCCDESERDGILTHASLVYGGNTSERIASFVEEAKNRYGIDELKASILGLEVCSEILTDLFAKFSSGEVCAHISFYTDHVVYAIKVECVLFEDHIHHREANKTWYMGTDVKLVTDWICKNIPTGQLARIWNFVKENDEAGFKASLIELRSLLQGRFDRAGRVVMGAINRCIRTAALARFIEKNKEYDFKILDSRFQAIHSLAWAVSNWGNRRGVTAYVMHDHDSIYTTLFFKSLKSIEPQVPEGSADQRQTHSISEVDSKLCPGVQIADILAWSYRRARFGDAGPLQLVVDNAIKNSRIFVFDYAHESLNREIKGLRAGHTWGSAFSAVTGLKP